MMRTWRVCAPSVAIVSLVLLAAGLSQVSFVGTHYESPREAPIQMPAGDALDAAVEEPTSVWAQALAVAVGVLLLISIISLIVRPRALLEALRRGLTAAAWFFVLFLIVQRWRNRPPVEQGSIPLGTGTPAGPAQPLPTIEQLRVPLWTTFFFVLLALLFLGTIILLFWKFWKSRTRHVPLEELAGLGKHAAEQLRVGFPVRQTILRCYRDMCQLLGERSHIEFSRAMTAREFEEKLAQIGIHEEHIARLSRLFEWARYGAGRPTPEQEAEALECLEIIARVYISTVQEDALARGHAS